MADVSIRISQALALRDMKQSDLIKITGISKGALSSYISGKYQPKQNNIYLMAKALNVNEAWLMGLDVPMERKKTDISTPADPDANELISNYKKLDDTDRIIIKSTVNTLLNADKYKKDTESSSA